MDKSTVDDSQAIHYDISFINNKTEAEVFTIEGKERKGREMEFSNAVHGIMEQRHNEKSTLSFAVCRDFLGWAICCAMSSG